MVRGCIGGLAFVLEIPLLKEPPSSRFVFSPKAKLISATETISLKKKWR